MGASSGPTTEITPEKPILVKTFVPRSIQYGLGEMYNTTAENATRALASRNAAIDSLLGRPTTPLVRDSGEVVAPSLAPQTFNPAIFFDPEENPYLQEEMDLAQRKRENRRKRRRQRQRGEDSRNDYLSMLSNRSLTNRSLDS